MKITPRRPSNNPTLRDALHALAPGESITTRQVDAPRLAGSLSRTTRRVLGTRLQTRTVAPGLVKITCVAVQQLTPREELVWLAARAERLIRVFNMLINQS